MSIDINLIPMHYNCGREGIFEQVCLCPKAQDLTYLNISRNIRGSIFKN